MATNLQKRHILYLWPPPWQWTCVSHLKQVCTFITTEPMGQRFWEELDLESATLPRQITEHQQLLTAISKNTRAY